MRRVGAEIRAFGLAISTIWSNFDSICAFSLFVRFSTLPKFDPETLLEAIIITHILVVMNAIYAVAF